MKKQYIQPACDLLAMDTTVSILAASPENVDTGGGTKEPIQKDDTGWAGSKGNTFGEWETDED